MIKQKWSPTIGSMTDAEAQLRGSGVDPRIISAGLFECDFWLNEEERLKYLKLPSVIKNQSVVYHVNDRLRRSLPIVQADIGYQMIMTGDSNTFGLASNIEDTWTYMLHDKLKNAGHVIPYINEAMAGHSLDAIKREYMMGPRQRPDLVILLAPPAARRELILKTGVLQFLPGLLDKVPPWVIRQHKPYVKLIEDMVHTKHEEANAYNVISSLIEMKRLIEANGGSFLWSHWSNDVYDQLEMFPDELLGCKLPKFRTTKADMTARDGLHFGPDAHRRWVDEIAEIVLAKINSR